MLLSLLFCCVYSCGMLWFIVVVEDNYIVWYDMVSVSLAPTCKPNRAQQAPARIPTCPKATPAFRYLCVCVSD